MVGLTTADQCRQNTDKVLQITRDARVLHTLQKWNLECRVSFGGGGGGGGGRGLMPPPLIESWPSPLGMATTHVYYVHLDSSSLGCPNWVFGGDLLVHIMLLPSASRYAQERTTLV